MNDSAKSPRMSDSNMTFTGWDSPTLSTPVSGSNRNFFPNVLSGGCREKGASISPRFISSTSYWCSVLMKVSPTSSTS